MKAVKPEIPARGEIVSQKFGHGEISSDSGRGNEASTEGSTSASGITIPSSSTRHSRHQQQPQKIFVRPTDRGLCISCQVRECHDFCVHSARMFYNLDQGFFLEFGSLQIFMFRLSIT